VAFTWDASLPGFGIIARLSRRRSWIAQYRIGRQSKRVALIDPRGNEVMRLHRLEG
jgi:hypothetical protein